MRIRQVVIDSRDPHPLAEFWAAATGRRVSGDAAPYLRLDDPDGRDVRLLIQRVDDIPPAGKNVVHIDLFGDDIDAERQRLVELGANVSEEIRDGDARWFVLTDPQGNEFCIIPT
ncbi:MAG TPA: VOC family protein [Actinomycetota bacterium]|nr:VOC family protein [Actinomycetota bacterium]